MRMARGREDLGRSFVTDTASTLPYWSHLYCKTCVALGEMWENPICLHDLLVHLEVPVCRNNGVRFQVQLSRTCSSAASCAALPTTG